MDPNKALNMTMLCDFYELTMGNGYLEHDMQDRITYFDVFFRSVPDDGGYAIAAGLEQIIDYIENLHFSDEDIAYLRSRKLFSEAFLDYLKDFRFTGDIWAVPEGTPVFPRELQVPIFRGGKLVYQKPALDDIRAYCADQLTTLWPEVLRFDYPHNYYVDLSEKLLKIKLDLLNAGGKSQG